MHFIDIYLNIRKPRADKLKQIYFTSTLPDKCDFCKFSSEDISFQKIKKFIFNIEKTPTNRYLTILGIKIITKRKKHNK
jgi:hypothetical protein